MRLRAVVRRQAGYSLSLLQSGDMSLSARQARFRDRPVDLTVQEYAVPELLVLRKGRVIPTQRLLCHLSADPVGPETRIIDADVCKVARKLAALGAEGLIGTSRDGGYMVRDEGGRANFGALTCRAVIRQCRPAGILALAHQA